MSFSGNYAELAELLEARKMSYNFFSSVYYQEASEEFVRQLVDFEADEGTKLAEFVASLKQGDIAEIAQDVRCDFARLYLNMSAHPVYTSESVYLSDNHIIMQEPRNQVVDIYRLNGLAVDKSFDWPEDHISMETLFMAHLCEQACVLARSVAAGEGDVEADKVKIDTFVNAQKAFFEMHLNKWVPDFCKLSMDEATTLFYEGVAEYFLEFLKAEEEYFNL